MRACAIEVPAVPSHGVAATSVPRLSIVALPFANLNNDPEQQYFADAITEDLTTELSRIPGMFVISRNTAFTYRDKPTHTKQIGRELGVRYALEGSVRRSGNQVRVNAQLIDAGTDAHLWAERFTGDLGDLFALQDEQIARVVVEPVGPQMRGGFGIDQLGVDADLVARPADTSFENVSGSPLSLRASASSMVPRSISPMRP